MDDRIGMSATPLDHSIRQAVVTRVTRRRVLGIQQQVTLPLRWASSRSFSSVLAPTAWHPTRETLR
jgi:hypothetical protein